MSLRLSSPLDKLLVRPEEYEAVVLEGITVIDGTAVAPQKDRTVVIRGDIVRDVLPAGAHQSPRGRGVRIIDGRGHFVMPGLIDCHVHLTGDHHESLYQRYMDAVPRTRVLHAARHAATILAAGVTTVRNLGHGDPAHVAAVQHAVKEKVLPGPRIQSAGWSVSQTGGHGNLRIWPYWLVERLRPRSAFADGPREASGRVRKNIEEGAECTKIYATEGVIYTPDRLSDIPNFSAAEIRAMTRESHSRNCKVAAHSTGVEGSIVAVDSGVDTIEHGPSTPDKRFLDAMLRTNATLVPTLSVFAWAAAAGKAGPYPEWVGVRAARQLEGRFAVVRAAKGLGIPIAMGSDSGGPPRGGQNAQELELLVESGLTPLEAISAGTRASAIALGLESVVGTVAPGMRADLLILKADPTADIGVLRRGGIESIIQPWGWK